MKISILTLFPEMFEGPFEHSILKRATEKKIVTIEFINIRDFGIGAHKMVDDKPYGGGVGMLLRVDVLHNALLKARCNNKSCKERIVLLDPQGKQLKQQNAKRLTKYNHLILICGHYEGVDNRIRYFIDEELSIGDYVLTGGEIPAMIIVDCVTRLISGVLKKPEAASSDSFSAFNLPTSNIQLLEYPQYTRPRNYSNLEVPKILVSGNHKEIEIWKKEASLKKTRENRPDLLKPRS